MDYYNTNQDNLQQTKHQYYCTIGPGSFRECKPNLFEFFYDLVNDFTYHGSAREKILNKMDITACTLVV